MSLEQLSVQLSELFSKEEYESCLPIITLVKRELVKHQLLVPNSKTNKSDLKITQSILEIGALTSLNVGQMDAFENYVNQLKPFYNGQSLEIQSKIMSLYLMYLLTQNNLALFHIELERFENIELLENDIYLSIPIKFEQWIIDGDYYKVFNNSQVKFPAKEFDFFKDELINSVRLSIAQNLQVSYKELKLENLKLLLYLKEVDESETFIDEMGWSVENGIVQFNGDIEMGELQDDKVLIKRTLGYAREMESIV
ncbi:proteasome regulatory particle lid subunit [Martiniozyma asiatica (nom. inval.)]|nr:proteasome regulatory particle lid subunit [Martiniozyma asiatica]